MAEKSLQINIKDGNAYVEGFPISNGMRLLIFTQKVDKNDPVLGFFHTWINELSKKVESVTVICLGKGEMSLPNNVTVYSLGKERSVSKMGYIINLYKYIFLIRGAYDKVFVHMNEEYVVLLGLYWRIKNIPIYMWRNHPEGGLYTRIAAMFSAKVFCTSNAAFVTRFKKTVVMPVGIDTTLFRPMVGILRKKHSVVILGRIAPIKRIELALGAIDRLIKAGTQASLTVIGSPLPKDIVYYDSLRKYVSDRGLSGYVQFVSEVTMNKVPEIFSGHEISLNLTPAGSFDKTIVESTACGALPLVSNESLQGLLPDVCITLPESQAVADSIQKLLEPHIKMEIQKDLEVFVSSQSLSALMDKLMIELQ